MADVPRYRFGPLERRGVLMGLRAGQLGVVASAIVVAVVALSSAPSASGLGVAALVGASRGPRWRSYPWRDALLSSGHRW